MTGLESTTSADVRCKEVLQMWLKWNDASQHVTELMFQERDNPDKLREILDDLDRMRLAAVSASQELLSS
ncbi:MAG TPA: hypothetical protein VG826_18655 [Pirellulales bacterium]|nr:hypothetical protein [Pirellulales bacterium]